MNDYAYHAPKMIYMLRINKHASNLSNYMQNNDCPDSNKIGSYIKMTNNISWKINLNLSCCGSGSIQVHRLSSSLCFLQ